MEKKEYQKLVSSTTPQPKRMVHTILAFLSGGMLGALCEIYKLVLINYFNFKESESISIILLTLIFFSCFLTAFLDFDKWVVKFKAGLIVPITGFAHSIQSSVIDYKKDGLITGLGANFFKLAGSVILYGVVSAFIFTILKVVFYG